MSEMRQARPKAPVKKDSLMRRRCGSPPNSTAMMFAARPRRMRSVTGSSSRRFARPDALLSSGKLVAHNKAVSSEGEMKCLAKK